MLLFLFNYWKYAVGLLAGGLLSWGVCHTIYTAKSAALGRAHTAAMQEQMKTLTAQCRKAQKTTEDASHEYQSQLSDLREQLARAKRVRPQQCVPVHPANPTAGCNGSTGNRELPLPNGGIAATALLDFAYDAEQVGRQLDACQAFVARERD